MDIEHLFLEFGMQKVSVFGGGGYTLSSSSLYNKVARFLLFPGAGDADD